MRQRNGVALQPLLRSSSCWAVTAAWSAGCTTSQKFSSSSSASVRAASVHAAGLARRMRPSVQVTTSGSGTTSKRRCSRASARVWESLLMASATITGYPRRRAARCDRRAALSLVIAEAAGTVRGPSMHDLAPGSQSTPTGPAPVSVHFVNNVLAAAASYIEVEPDTARDVLASLGAFLSHRLRPARIVPLAQELDHVAVYVRLEQARFPGRLEAELPSTSGVPSIECAPGEVQAPLADALGRWLGERRGRVRLALRTRLDGSALEAQLDEPDEPATTAERVRIALHADANGSAT